MLCEHLVLKVVVIICAKSEEDLVFLFAPLFVSLLPCWSVIMAETASGESPELLVDVQGDSRDWLEALALAGWLLQLKGEWLSSSLVGAHNRPKWGCISQVLKEEILLTPLHLMAVVKKGKISPFLAVASICTQWNRQYKWWDFALLFTFVTLGSLYWGTMFSTVDRFGSGLLCFFEIWKIGESGVFDVFFSDFDILEHSLTRGCIRKEVCWVILVPRVDNFLQNHDELYSRKNSSPGKRKMIHRLVKEKREHSISKWNKGVWLRTWINLSWQFKCKQAHESARLAT